MPKLEETCPKCNNKGAYQKGWDMTKKRQKKGAKQGTVEPSGDVIRISLYKCKGCKRLFRKAEIVKNGNIRNKIE